MRLLSGFLSGFLIRFLIFWFKIACACFFVILLQVQVGQKSVEEWIEQELKQSTISQYLKNMAQAEKRVINQKFPLLKGLAQNKIMKNNAIVEWHSGLFKQMEQSFDNFDSMEESQSADQRDISSHQPVKLGE